ncbi:low molecular weight protein-tyrosine-phosphatase [Paraburkholderia phenoliruptrix]|uniref:low molecular weight protein-tyrosine-phosphatase n=1 Tax=Paraburkholderia phenoliruptrix TaxID=252970 RepID=UPI001C6EE359|nr:low molecular weight protein-tyrosine-phosphatase [Paraburkholderia phenoliruptrix]MBW9106777.1 low molecular weight phosphotyrosine protein phosphatase [Paraburkholderia phenoliruptrix]MBW9131834.1 low molecular weight phosphotyrosine protein phosphatase [Paraburkholderia ginsengiterrae]
MIRSMLVVCVGNICRSPMAEYLLRRELEGIAVTSAGLDALAGYAADPAAVQVCAENGLDITQHRARQLNAALVSASDLILTMEDAHRQEIMRRHPSARGKVFRIGDAHDFDVPDPYRKPLSHFYGVYELIARGAASWTSRIKALA